VDICGSAVHSGLSEPLYTVSTHLNVSLKFAQTVVKWMRRLLLYAASTPVRGPLETGLMVGARDGDGVVIDGLRVGALIGEPVGKEDGFWVGLIGDCDGAGVTGTVGAAVLLFGEADGVAVRMIGLPVDPVGKSVFAVGAVERGEPVGALIGEALGGRVGKFFGAHAPSDQL
jgi:hypothetical protein